MKQHWWRWSLALGILLSSVYASVANVTAPLRPNILFILSDDHAWQAISAYGSRLIQTPEIDRLAAGGVRFDRAFCTESLCGPSRAALMTGKYGHVTGARGWVAYDRRHRTFPEYLQAAGYQTALFGKYHLGENPPGFHSSAILPGQGRYLNPQLITKEGTNLHLGHVSDVLTQLSLDWLSSRDTNKPFLLCIHHKAAHMPWEPAARHWDMFAEKTFPEPSTLFGPHGRRADGLGMSILTIANLRRWQKQWPILDTGDPTEQVRSMYQTYMRHYAATAAGIDESVGTLLDFLDTHGLSENTMVIYASDQGFFLGEHGWFDKRWMLEEAQRLPLVVRYPRLVKAQKVSRELVLNLDLAPTLLEVAGVPVPGDMHGRSLVPLLSGKTPRDWRRAVYYRYHDRQYGIPPHFGIRTKRYKLIHYKGPAAIDNGSDLPPLTNAREIDEWEMFDLKKDPNETRDLYHLPGTQRLVRRLKGELEKLRQALGDLE